ncbi:EpsG family protein [Limosilactobacillus reuteri]|uniref:EpsG family protein n=1 Tax=Limosilactobacillus reuteri TaxID=1598 RepID=UPI00223EFC42|nr:EpsG family protein [Limosilactobacillus reuteri]UZM91127.1 EpsG family protein [Limosilactobacillus reuteri]
MVAYFIIYAINLLTSFIYRVSRKWYAWINGLAIWILMSFRSYSVGSDTINYINLYSQIDTISIPHNILNWFYPTNGARFENGYLLLNKFLYSISKNPRFLLIITSAIFVICLVYLCTQLDLNMVIGFICFESLGFMSFFLSGIRQALACSFCMVAFVFVVKKRPIIFLIFVYLAMSMHVSAIIFILTYMFNFLKNNAKSYLLVTSCSAVFIFYFDKLFTAFSSKSEELSNFSLSTENSGGYLNVILSVLIIISVMVMTKHLMLSKSIMSVRYSNYMLLIAIVFYLISLASTQIARVAMYFEIGLFVDISYIYIYYRRKNVIMCNLIILLMIASFVVIQVFRPERTGIVPYVWLN